MYTSTNMMLTITSKRCTIYTMASRGSVPSIRSMGQGGMKPKSRWVLKTDSIFSETPSFQVFLVVFLRAGLIRGTSARGLLPKLGFTPFFPPSFLAVVSECTF